MHTKRAADQERNRRTAWEHEQEAKLAQREAELQKQLEDMKAEMALLKAVVTMQHQEQGPSSSQDPILLEPEQMNHVPPLPAPSARIEEVQTQVVSPSPSPEEHSPQGYDWSTYSLSNVQPPLLPTFVEGSSTCPLISAPPDAAYNYSYPLGSPPSPVEDYARSPKSRLLRWHDKTLVVNHMA